VSALGLAVPRTSYRLGGGARPHPYARYLTPDERRAAAAFAAAIIGALEDSGREWLVLPAGRYRSLLPAGHRWDAEGVAGAMLRAAGLSLHLGGGARARYLVVRESRCPAGGDHGREFRLLAGGRVGCDGCARADEVPA
jgi:hypothetical protein